MDGWGCVKRLFPNTDIQYDLPNLTIENPTLSSKLSPMNDPGKFITCAIMEMKPISHKNNPKKNQLYFKSETVVKGENYGWALGTFVSTMPQENKTSNKYEASFDFVYRLIVLKKTSNSWEVDGGVMWDHFSYQQFSTEKMVISPPINPVGWFTVKNPRRHYDDTSFREIMGAGIGEVDNNPKTASEHILKSISIHNVDSVEANVEVWGGEGDFVDKDNKGYVSVNKFYEKGQGWKAQKQRKNISSELRNWYKPFRDKKIKWTGLWDRCNAWSRIRNRPTITSVEEDIKALCYSKAVDK